MDTVVTHNGPFHADDVLACVIFGALMDNREVIRTRDEEEMEEADVVVDVGRKFDHDDWWYDHHQPSFRETHPDGTPKAAAGLAWEYSSYLFNNFSLYGEREDQVREIVRERFIKGVDAADNGEAENDTKSVSSIIAGLNPRWDEDADFDDRFEDAMRRMKAILDREIEAAIAQVKAEESFRSSLRIEDGQIAVLEQYLPWTGMEVDEDLLYVVFPASGGGWRVQQVPTEPGSRDGRKPLPESWVEDEPSLEGGDCIFVHKGRFIAGATSRRAAMDMARQALEA